MRSRRLVWLFAAMLTVMTACGRLRAAPPASAGIPALIDKLTEVSDQDIGYSARVSGEAFLPLDSSGQISVILLDEKPLVPSDTLRQLVKRGVAAVPHLIAHLDDKRPTRIKVDTRRFLNRSFSDYFDRNEQTAKPDAASDEQRGGSQVVNGPYTIRVGDLCFVAIGQIVNRRYDAVTYFPTANILITSPVRSPNLRKAVQRAWGSLTPERHRASLIADFLKPDHEQRRIGASKRLAYYYPDAVEPLALQYLARRTYAPWDIEKFVHEKLYREPDPGRCRALFGAYIKQRGEAARDGILLRLFEDLRELEWSEKEPSADRPDFTDQPRKLLHQLYGWPKGVKAKDRPEVDSLEDPDKARVIREGLIYDHSEKVDWAVRALLTAADPEGVVGWACIDRLVGRGYDAEIEAFCRRQLKRAADARDRECVQEVLDKLGWTPLHVAASRGNCDSLSALPRGAAKVNTPARDGKTPLHVAAEAGHPECVMVLLDHQADIAAKDRRGRTPLDLARQAEQAEVIKLLEQRQPRP